MVEFYDPITKNIITYHIDSKLKKKWDLIRDGKLAELDEDRVYLVDGRERTGKSVWTLQQAKYIDPTFDIDRVCFTPDEFLYAIRHAPKGSVVVFDEAFRGLSSKASRSKVNKAIVQALMEVGQRNLIIFIVLPTIFLLELYAAALRSEALFHIYKLKKRSASGKRLRAFRIYNYKKKIRLYLIGKTKGFSYSQPKTKSKGRFFNYYPINEKAYRSKKDKSFVKQDQYTKDEDKYIEMYYKTVYCLRNELKLSEKAASELLNSYNLTVSASNVGEICRKISEKCVKPPNTQYPYIL